MNRDPHERAKKLAEAIAVEGISDGDRAWLDGHLDDCRDCRAHAESIRRTLSALRAVSVPVAPGLLEATRRRVAVRAHELREEEARMRALWISCTLSWVLGAISAPLLWWGLEWLGARIAFPKPVWYSVFVLSWMVPAALTAAGLVWRRSRARGQNGYATPESES